MILARQEVASASVNHISGSSNQKSGSLMDKDEMEVAHASKETAAGAAV